MFWLLVVIAAFLFLSIVVLRGENLSYLDQPIPSHPARPQSDGMRKVLKLLSGFNASAHPFGRKRLDAGREFFDQLGERHDYVSEFVPVNAADVCGEWVMPPDAQPKKRILYIHGGAFLLGSPLSHRPITDRLARLTGAAVFALDYRLMPEASRSAGIEDCRRAYRWIIDNGPDGVGTADSIVVAGDSAGGNLTLMVLAWARDQGLRQADAGVAFSPATDAVLDAPSMRANVASDRILGPGLGSLLRVPNLLLLWVTLASSRMLPKDPRLSPLRGNLARLPPILLQVSDSEMLLDDSRRYAAKARAAESPVVLQTWPDMPHVWQYFSPELEEAEDAFQKVGEFLERVLPSTPAAHAAPAAVPGGGSA